MKQWYVRLFKNYADKYEHESFVKGTLGEVDFIESEIGRDKHIRILDIGCGTGRHAIELARRGYNVTGMDLSAAQLKKAGEKAAAAGVSIRFLRKDARSFSFKNKFGLVITLCEGGFALMETDEMNFQILKNAASALRPGGKLILTTLNALFPLAGSPRALDALLNKDAANTAERNNRFDILTFRHYSMLKAKDDSGKSLQMHTSERFYAPSEITWLLKSLGFRKISIFGAKLGKFSRKHKLTPKDFEMLVIAKKTRGNYEKYYYENP